jgi:hypothetical protein
LFYLNPHSKSRSFGVIYSLAKHILKETFTAIF